eukprot:CAMPEP_0177731370 /NCGR_PEP_ID=MMETSP0484_2-20121128/22517_1 /TAXON_ID=354590 /ORGANISM="Rhodomonas lens, Strain RHODO" /LENGTH=32 /DNA_ID= /DNA_START= /DNA_END= /DNA_ORIENTATION=
MSQEEEEDTEKTQSTISRGHSNRRQAKACALT